MYFPYRVIKQDYVRDDNGRFAETDGEGTSTPKDVSGLTKVGGNLGSNPGGVYTDKDGKKFYVKESKSEEHASNEILAGKLYAAAGAPIVEAEPITLANGKTGTVSAWRNVEDDFNPNNPDHVKEVQQHFGTHAWLGNWDAVGLVNDNQVKIGGKFTTVDAGGSLKFRAQGGPKSPAQYGPEVGELKTMRDRNIGPQSAKVFGPMDAAALRASTKGVAGVSDQKIKELVNRHGYGSQSEKDKHADLLIARKNNLLSATGGG